MTEHCSAIRHWSAVRVSRHIAPLPVTQGKKAKALAVPPPLLAGADEVIEIELQIAAVHELTRLTQCRLQELCFVGNEADVRSRSHGGYLCSL